MGGVPGPVRWGIQEVGDGGVGDGLGARGGVGGRGVGGALRGDGLARGEAGGGGGGDEVLVEGEELEVEAVGVGADGAVVELAGCLESREEDGAEGRRCLGCRGAGVRMEREALPDEVALRALGRFRFNAWQRLRVESRRERVGQANE